MTNKPLGLEAMRDIPHTIETIEGVYNFTSDAGPLTKCGEWNYLKRILASLQLPEAEVQSSDGEKEPDDTRKGTAALLSPADADPEIAGQLARPQFSVDRLAPSEANSPAAPVGNAYALVMLAQLKSMTPKEFKAYHDKIDDAVRAISAAPASAGVREALVAFVKAYGSQESSTKGLDDALAKAKAALTTAFRDVTGWLIEKGDPPEYATLTADYDEHWTTDASDAIRFARQIDAQAYSDHIGWTSPPVRVTEHMWCEPRAALSSQPVVNPKETP